LIVLGVITLSVAAELMVVSRFQHRSAQQSALDSFRKSLAKGTAPVGQKDSSGHHLLALGTPVALLDIPAIGVHEVVLEGTTAGVLKSGPGHRRNSALPGQVGSSVVFGRQASFGGPFKRLDELRAGNRITVTTGQGVSKYRVVGRRYKGDPVPPPPASGSGRLVLVTAAGTQFVPSGELRVDADLVTPANPAPAAVITAAAMAPSEEVMAADTSTPWALVLWLQALVAAAVGVVWSWNRWGHHQTWIVFVPLITLLGFAVAGEFTKLLPNLL
jgi:sortase (surface protein transpeptidase)